MYKQFTAHGPTAALEPADFGGPAITHSGGLDALVALEQIGTCRSFGRDEEIYAEGDRADCWYRVVSGTVRICKLLVDGRRHIAEFCCAGDYFGLPPAGTRAFSAEAVGQVVVMRYPQRAADRLLDQDSRLARGLCNLSLRDLAHAQVRMMVLGRMTAAERVASFLLEMSERHDGRRTLDLPMSRTDIADYLGLTIETVCRVLSAFKRDRVIDIPTPHRIELRCRDALEALAEA